MDPNQMAPDASPDTMSKASGGRRINNLPAYLLGLVVAGFLLVMALVAMDRSEQQNKESTTQQQKPVGSSAMAAKEIVGDRVGGVVKPAPVIKASAPTAAAPILIARPDNLDAPPAPPVIIDEEAQRIRMAKLQMLEEAIKAKTTVPTTAARSTGSAIGNNTGAPQTREEILARIAAVRKQIEAQRSSDPTGAYQARLAQIRSGLGATEGTGAATLIKTAASTKDAKDYAQFASSNDDDRWKLNSKPQAPRSPYELRAGFVLPATLISGINSELPGQIVAQVAQNVYDTASGQYLLIPQGSRLVGAYSSDVAYGQSRVLVAWQRIVFPDGKALDIGAMPGSDSAGYSGFNDQVNNHYFRIFASAFLMSGVTAGIAMSQTDKPNLLGRPDASSALSAALGQQLGQVTAKMIEKNLNIAPTLEIRPGYRFNVVVTKDMTFSKPYRSFDY